LTLIDQEGHREALSNIGASIIGYEKIFTQRLAKLILQTGI